MYKPIEETDIYRRATALADGLFQIAERWTRFRQDTIGTQMCRSADSIAANLVEGDARLSDKESLRFFDYSRCSARELRHWIRRAAARALIDEETARALDSEVETLSKMLTGLMKHRRTRLSLIKEEEYAYDAEAT